MDAIFVCVVEDTNRHSMFGAGDEARTRDIQLGRLKLYQLSYSRSFCSGVGVRQTIAARNSDINVQEATQFD